MAEFTGSPVGLAFKPYSFFQKLAANNQEDVYHEILAKLKNYLEQTHLK